MPMNRECRHIAEEIRSTFEGEAWYGDSVQKLLQGVTAGQAFAHPMTGAHSIWELVLHVNAWAEAAVNALRGIPIAKFPWPQEKDFPPLTDRSEAAWQQAVNTLFSTHKQFWQAIEAFEDNRLEEKVPGRSYTFYKLFMGWADHMIYHAGQIALLKKVQS
ncbi:MAG: hypothetical protein DMG65_16795 [Candidatus Angelobacter sp. Gp1-AA117]|nr:MAG: hypothetical protein DMG65_16795 [Candidatus Angelobacter sp. Gp1-AA117]